MPRIRSTSFDDGFAWRRDALIATVTQNLDLEDDRVQHVGEWLDSRFPARTVIQHISQRHESHRLRAAGQPTLPNKRGRSKNINRDGEIRGDDTGADRLAFVFEHLFGQNQHGTLGRLLGRNLPAGELETNAIRAVVVTSCVLDPNVADWLGPVTPLAGCPWNGDPSADPPQTGRSKVSLMWGHDALKMLDEAIGVLGWATSAPQPPTSTLDLNSDCDDEEQNAVSVQAVVQVRPTRANTVKRETTPAQKPGAWTKSELVDQAEISGSTFDNILKGANVTPSVRGGQGQRRRFCADELKALITEVEAGTYRKKDGIAAAWQRLLDPWRPAESQLNPK
jgi:hypothetical protein